MLLLVWATDLVTHLLRHRPSFIHLRSNTHHHHIDEFPIDPNINTSSIMTMTLKQLTNHSLLYISLALATGGARALSAVSTSGSKRKQIVKTEDVPGLKNGMDYVKLGDSDLILSNICMGT